MKQKQIINMTCMSAIEKLKQWSAEYMSDCAHNINIVYDKDRPLCTGTTQYDDNGIPVNVNIGIAPLTTAFPARYRSITDSDFVKMGVTTFHELTHCEMSLSNSTPKEILISDLSKCYNEDYYYAVHHKLPHEIDAEYNGVMTMWSILENEWPDAADRLMFDYLDYRTEKFGNIRKLYMIERPEGGFQSKQQVKDLFDEAYEKSLTRCRSLPEEFLTYGGDTSKLLATDDGRGVRTEYIHVYLKLLKADNGTDTDQMMASLVSHIHPELQSMYSGLDFEELEPDRVFNVTMPETTDESRVRLGYDDSFASSVDYVTRLQDKGPEL